nr:hypothetical protein [Brevibacillus laterosporus]
MTHVRYVLNAARRGRATIRAVLSNPTYFRPEIGTAPLQRITGISETQ